MDSILNKKLTELKRTLSHLQLISSHDVLVLLKAFCSASKVMHRLCSSPCTEHDILIIIDNKLQSCLINITSVSITILCSQPVDNLATKQHSCDQTTVEKIQSSLLASQTTQYHRALLHAALAPHFSDWQIYV